MHTKEHYWLSFLFSAQLDPTRDIFSAENIAFSAALDVKAIELTNKQRYRTWHSNWPAKVYFTEQDCDRLLNHADQTKALVLKSQFNAAEWRNVEGETPAGFEDSKYMLFNWRGPRIGHMQDARPRFAKLLHDMLACNQLDKIYYAGNKCSAFVKQPHKYLAIPNRTEYLRYLFYYTPIGYCNKLEQKYFEGRDPDYGVFSCFQMDEERARFLNLYAPPTKSRIIGRSSMTGIYSITENRPVPGVRALELANMFGWQLLHLNSSLIQWGGWITPRIAQCLKQNQLLLIPSCYRKLYEDLFSKEMLDANCVADKQEVQAKIQQMQTWEGYVEAMAPQKAYVDNVLLCRDWL